MKTLKKLSGMARLYSAVDYGEKPTRARVKDLLINWRHWARDCEPDSAEIHYYTISPDFRDYVKPTPKWVTYDSDSAEMVEHVLSSMFKTYPKEREIIILYWICIRNVRDLADVLCVSKSTLYRRLSEAEDRFAEQWAILFYNRGTKSV